jgi:hypothetical protein
MDSESGSWRKEGVISIIEFLSTIPSSPAIDFTPDFRENAVTFIGGGSGPGDGYEFKQWYREVMNEATLLRRELGYE